MVTTGTTFGSFFVPGVSRAAGNPSDAFFAAIR
jgi:hypothetical protein